MAEAHEYGWVRFPDEMGGTQRWIKFDEKGEITIRRETPMAIVQQQLDHNKAARNHTRGTMLGGSMVRAMSVPEGVRIKWMVEEGWDCQKPENNDRLVRKMNDLDYLYLRTGGGRVALQQDGTIR